MKPFLIAAGVLVLIGVGAGYLLIPKHKELALMQLKHNVFDKAKKNFEAQLAAGDTSVAVVGPLADLHLHFGEVEKAVTLMERSVAENPNDPEALRRLGKYYQYSQRPDDYLRNLEILRGVASSAEVLRELSNLYNFNADYEKQADVLAEVVERYDATPEEHLALAHLQTSRGKFDEAGRTLERLADKNPVGLDDGIVELMLNLLLDSNRLQVAFDQAVKYLAQTRDSVLAARLAGLFEFKGHPGTALKLLAPFTAEANDEPELLEQLVYLEGTNGFGGRAIDRLRPLYENRTLPEDLQSVLVDLALQLEQYDLAFEVAENTDLARFPDWLLSGVVEAAVILGRKDISALVVRRLGQEFLAARPVLAARLAVQQDDGASMERWIRRALADTDLPIDDRLDLAALLGELGRVEHAVALLRDLAERPDTPETVMTDLANYYLKLGQAVEGARFFADLRNRRPSDRTDAAWAVLAAAAGQGGPVQAWLDSETAADLPLELLTDLYFIANDNQVTGLALATAERLYAKRPDGRNRMALIRALIGAGRASDALIHVRDLRAGGLDIERLYLTALNAARKAGAPVQDEIRAFLVQKVNDKSLPPGFREEVVYGLLAEGAYKVALPPLRALAEVRPEDWAGVYLETALKLGRTKEVGRYLRVQLENRDLSQVTRESLLYTFLESADDAEALPYLREFAEAYGGDWLFGYEEALVKLGRRDEVLAFMRARLTDPNLTDEARQAIAFRFLEAGRKDEAEVLFRVLADGRAAGHPAVQQLLFLWGPRTVPANLDWIEARTKAAPRGSERAGWIEHLVNSGGIDRALAFIDTLAAAGEMDGPTFEAYLGLLGATGDRDRVAAVIEDKLGTETNPVRLRRYGRMAQENGLTAAALAAYERVLYDKPDDAEALRAAGLSALALGRHALAHERLSRHHANNAGDYESHHGLALAAAGLGCTQLADFQFVRALELVEAASGPSYDMRLARANILRRMGRIDDSIAAFETLNAERPSDPGVRADYADLLLESRLYDRAGKILAIP